MIDEEIKKILHEATEKSKEIIKKYHDKINLLLLLFIFYFFFLKFFLKSLALALVEKETLDLDHIIEILGERPFPIKENFKAYLETKKIAKDAV